jgi:endoglucanase
MGEFGAGVHCFENNKGGVQWVNDMIDIAQANNIYFTYHDYHEDNFGLYYAMDATQSNTGNQALLNLFNQNLNSFTIF